MFDPETVERMTCDYGGLETHPEGDLVYAKDYESLLERYNLLLSAEPAKVVPFKNGYWVFAKDYSFFTVRPENGQCPHPKGAITDRVSDRMCGVCFLINPPENGQK